MKKLIFIVILLLSLKAISQQVMVYNPLRTYHWNRDKEMLQEYSGTEGGNIGAVLIIRFSNKSFQDIQLGVIRNSFGDTSYLIQYGIGKTFFKKVDASINIGLISGYDKLYKLSNLPNEIFPNIMIKNGVIPSTVLCFSYNSGIIRPTINISPTFINAGLTINLTGAIRYLHI